MDVYTYQPRTGAFHNPILKPIYQNRQKRNEQATGVVTHKILQVIYAILKSGKAFNAESAKENRERAQQNQHQ